MSNIRLNHDNGPIEGEIRLGGSKSISNRVLIIRALCDEYFDIENLSDSDDTKVLDAILREKSHQPNTGHAGTAYRFLTAYLAYSCEEAVTLSGSARMHERPIGELVEALKSLGADIEYIDNEHYPPLQIRPSKILGSEVSLKADISSQYISALLLIAPSLAQGLTIHMESEPISRPYIEMTLRIMAHFGIEHQWKGLSISIAHQSYKARDYYVESDWSSASYTYADLAVAPSGNIIIHGLTDQKLQGDSAIANMMQSFGIETTYGDRQIIISKKKADSPAFWEYNFIEQPDLAQTICVIAAATGTQLLLSGLQTLKIKETDRIMALKQELAKVGVSLVKLPAKFSSKSGVQYYMQEGRAQSEDIPQIATYKDHRMAMSFAVLAQIMPILVENPEVVSKSYPDFWTHKKNLGYECLLDHE